MSKELVDEAVFATLSAGLKDFRAKAGFGIDPDAKSAFVQMSEEFEALSTKLDALQKAMSAWREE